MCCVMCCFECSECYPLCFDAAAGEYGISTKLLSAIALYESGYSPNAVHYNTDGSYDFGVMQINSGWYATLGHGRWMALADPCYNVRVGAWILSQCIRRYGYTWEAVGCYNAKNSLKRVKYAWKIFNALKAVEKSRSNMYLAAGNNSAKITMQK